MHSSRFQNGNDVQFGDQARGIRGNRRRLTQEKGSEGTLQVIHGVAFGEGHIVDVSIHRMRLGRHHVHGVRVREGHERKVRQRRDQPAQQYAGEQGQGSYGPIQVHVFTSQRSIGSRVPVGSEKPKSRSYEPFLVRIHWLGGAPYIARSTPRAARNDSGQMRFWNPDSNGVPDTFS